MSIYLPSVIPNITWTIHWKLICTNGKYNVLNIVWLCINMLVHKVYIKLKSSSWHMLILHFSINDSCKTNTILTTYESFLTQNIGEKTDWTSDCQGFMVLKYRNHQHSKSIVLQNTILYIWQKECWIMWLQVHLADPDLPQSVMNNVISDA